MAYNDKKFGQLFPTRHGGATGTANERQMLDALGGTDGYRTRYQTNLDGSVTRCDTKNGMPQFTTSLAPTDNVVTYDIYMESGQLEWTYPGELNPDRLDSAKWHFLDIPATGEYLGYIAGAPPSFGAQENQPALTEGMYSRAIGYPKSADATTDAASQTAYGGATLTKKISCLFPSSLFSGKMRLFLQAQYGAMETLAAFPLVVETIGSSTILKYESAGFSVQFGLWAHHSPGIFTAPDGTFWLITITKPTGTGYLATAYAIKQGVAGKALLDEYKSRLAAGTLGAGERVELEAYIFAHSTIDTANPQLIGAFAGAAGGPLAYGWKWNSDGSKASIVVHETLGTGAGDLRWKASTINVVFSYEAGALSLTSAVVAGGEWTDGWGVYNIFAPESDLGTRLGHVSLATNRTGVKPAFNFSGVPVYGYYKDDVWMPITMSRSVATGPFPLYTQSYSGLSFCSTIDLNITNVYEYAYMPATAGMTYESHSLSASTTMGVTVGSAAYAGSSASGTHIYLTKSVAVGGTVVASVDFSGNVGGSYCSPVGGVGGEPYDSGHPGDADRPAFMTMCRITLTRYTWIGAVNSAWTLVLPGGDCEAAYVATYAYNQSDAFTHTVTSDDGVCGFSGIGWYSGVAYDVEPWAAVMSNGWYGINANVTYSTTAAAPADQTTSVYCFNATISGVQGSPGGSYSQLFEVDYTYPYYDRGMYTYTSASKRYVMSEGLKSSASVDANRRFVGWA